MSSAYQNGLNDEAFEQVNNLLQEQEQPEIHKLTFKINELQKIITTLTQANERLIIRIEELQYEIEEKNNTENTTFNEEYSVMHCNFNDIEDMIKQYKKELLAYQDNMKAQLSHKSNSIAVLQQQSTELNNTIDNLQVQIEEMQIENDQLEQNKESLINQMEQLESSLRRSKMESPRYLKSNEYSNISSRMEHHHSSDFNINVQLELQKLIQKLVKELEHERYSKKKLTEEIKQLQKSMLDQQKQIMAKNTKIYSLEITALKKNKLSHPTRPQSDQASPLSVARTLSDPLKQKGHEERRGKVYESNYQERKVSRDANKSKMKTFTLMQLMNECTVLTSNDKLAIALKLIDLYLKKLQRNDYSMQILQTISIVNFTPTNPQLCQVKINPNITKDHDNEDKDKDHNQTQLGWNLVFILDNLFSQTKTKDRNLGETHDEQTLLQAITYFLENKEENSMESILQIRKVVQDALNERMR